MNLPLTISQRRWPGSVGAANLARDGICVDREETFDDYVARVMQSSAFRLALASTNPKLYRIMLANEPLALKNGAIIRYLHRYMFRSTPSGLLGVAEDMSGEPCTVSVDIGHSCHHVTSSGREHSLVLNPTMYTVRGDRRFLRVSITPSSYSEALEMVLSSEAIELLTSTFESIGFIDRKLVEAKIREGLAVSADDAHRFVDELIESDILRLPCIDPLIRKEVSEPSVQCDLTSSRIVGSCATLLSTLTPAAINDLSHAISAAHPEVSERRLLNIRGYVSAKTPVVDLNKSLVHVEDLLWVLGRRVRPLASFAAAFEKQYGSSWVPLLVALDDQVGVDYAPRAESFEEGECGRVTDAIRKRAACAPRASELCIDDLITDSLRRKGRRDGSVVGLLERRRATVGCSSVSYALRVVSNTGLIRPFGRLLREGDPRLAKLRSAVRELDDCAGVLHADVLASVHPGVGDVTRRARVTDHVIVLSGESADTSYQRIPASDIDITVENGSVILRSRSRAKIISPLLGTAMSPRGSGHRLLRFLMDVEAQDSVYYSDIMLRDRDTRYVPGMRYKNILVSPRQWRISENNSNDVRAELARGGSQELPRYVQFGAHDQLMTIDLSSSVSRKLLIDEIRRSGEMWVAEAPDQDPLRDIGAVSRGDREICFAHITPAAKPRVPSLVGSNVKRSGDKHSREWIYLQINVRPEGVPYLLDQVVRAIVEDLKRDMSVNDWHYLIYPTPSNHIRLRVRTCPSQRGEVRDRILSHLSPPECASRFGWQEAPYLPEYHRYGDSLEIVHQLWTVDSEIALDAWRDLDGTDTRSNITRCVSSIGSWLTELVPEVSARRAVIKAVLDGYSAEFSTKHSLAHRSTWLNALRRDAISIGSPLRVHEASHYGIARALVQHLAHISCARLASSDLRRCEWIAFSYLRALYGRDLNYSAERGANA